MRCPSCNKFPAFSTDNEPEVEISDCVIELSEAEDGSTETAVTSGTAVVSGTARICLTTECCGDEVKETTFDIEMHIEVAKAEDCTCDGDEWHSRSEAECESSEVTDRSESSKTVTYKRGPKKGTTEQVLIPLRYRRRFYGVSAEIVVKCGCRKQIGMETFTDQVQASGMDEMC